MSRVLLIFLPIFVFCEIKIGYIDSKRVFGEYKGREEIEKQFQAQVEKWKKEAIKMKQEIENLIQLYDSQSIMLSAEKQEERRDEIRKKQNEYEAFIEKIWGVQGEAQKLNEEMMKPFVAKVDSILQKIGKEENYTLIFDAAQGGIVYAMEGIDLTDRVIAEVNKEFAPTPIEKTYFFVFNFKEQTTEAKEMKLGSLLVQYFRVAFLKTGKYEYVLESKLNAAFTAANINKKEEEYTIEDIARVGKLAETKFAVTGEVTKVGDKVDIVCKVIDTEKVKVIAEERGSSPQCEREDLNKLVGEIVSKLMIKM